MTENDSPVGGPEHAPDPIVEKGRGISLVWVIPIVAVVAGAIIAWDAFRSRGVDVTITVPNAEWVEAGKTKVRYLDVDIGIVNQIHLNETLDRVELDCELHRHAKPYLTEGAIFWLVHPRFGPGGISGLGTFLSGAYVAMRLGPEGGKPKTRFEAVDVPPLESTRTPGLSIELHADALYSLDVGSPVYYREIEVGRVERYDIADDGEGLVLHVFFRKEHAHLVREDSRFWNAGGVQLSGNLTHFQIDTNPLEALLMGGIAFDAPRGDDAPPAKDGAKFWLHPTKADVDTYAMRYGGLRVFVESPQLGSVAIGDHVFYRELPVGAVISQELVGDSRLVRVGLNVQHTFAPLVRSNSIFWNASGISAHLGLSGLEIHAESLASILRGGVAFATPDPPGAQAAPGSVFEMRDEVDEKWLGWSPSIRRGSAPTAGGAPAKTGERSVEPQRASEEGSAGGAEPAPEATRATEHDHRRHLFFSRRLHGE